MWLIKKSIFLLYYHHILNLNFLKNIQNSKKYTYSIKFLNQPTLFKSVSCLAIFLWYLYLNLWDFENRVSIKIL